MNRQQRANVSVVPHRRHEGLFIVNGQLCTKNLFPGDDDKDDLLFLQQNEDGTEEVHYRVWDPSTSPLAAVVLKGVDYFSIKPGAKVLYLGAASLATVSHLSDIVGSSGMVYAVTSFSSLFTQLSDMAIKRTNVTPINEDPSDPFKYRNLVGTHVDVMLSEIPLDCQVQMMALNASYFLKVGGHFVVSFEPERINFGLPIPFRSVIVLQYSRLHGHRLEPSQEVNIGGGLFYYVGTYKGRAQVESQTTVKHC
ncbi:rRNA 2'-O-methyltransferase fibrillarin 2-like [Apium graveolens]|uniref:Fibrillarin n=1 Tax=Apium graveolens TaxID=4045 RepID=A0A6L5BAR2_APIGR|nr:hypothetical protein AG4045_027606 [Apium graveolens]